MKISCSEVGSITLIETALLGLFGLVFLLAFYAFQTSAAGIVTRDKCVIDSTEIEDSELVDPNFADLADPCEKVDPSIDHPPPGPGDTDLGPAPEGEDLPPVLGGG